MSSWQHFRGLRGKGIPTDNRHSHGHKLCPSLSRLISVPIRSGIHTVVAPGRRKRLASQFNFTYRYIDDVLSINNPDFKNYLGQMYHLELEMKDTTESNTSASYLDLLLSIGRDGQLRTSLYDKRDNFNFHITNFPFLSSNIPSSPTNGVFISQLSDTPGLATLMNVLFCGRCDFRINFSGRDMLRNVSKEVLWSIWGSYQSIWGSPIPNVTRHSEGWSYTVTPSWSDIAPILTLYWPGPYYWIWLLT